MATTRKSGRSRQPSRKYSVEAFDDLDLTDGNDTAMPEHDAQDDDFDDAMISEASEDEASGDGDNEEHLENYDDANEQDDEDDTVATPSRKQNLSTSTQPPRQTTYRGGRRGPRPAVPGNASKTMRYKHHFGADPHDQQCGLQANYKWKDLLTLPSRTANAAGFGSFSHGFFRSTAQRKEEMDEDWQWYDDGGGRELLDSRREIQTLDDQEGRSYLPAPTIPQLSVVMGPYGKQRAYGLECGIPRHLNEPFRAVEDMPVKIHRHGWMINLGDNVQCLAWAPNRSGSPQYLAVATKPLRSPAPLSGRDYAPNAPAFTPQGPAKAAIQIWEVSSTAESLPDEARPPRLRSVICTDWSNIREMKWCLTPRRDPEASDQSQKIHLGLLAGVWSDGAVRVLDIHILLSADGPVEYIRQVAAPFTSRPPHTVCTSVTWLSSHAIAAGCADGSVVIWDLISSLSSIDRESPPPVCTFNVQSSYIQSIASGYPSRPQILLTSSMSGYTSMTDLSELSSASGYSSSSTVLGKRSRIGTYGLSWYDWGQTALSIDDSSNLVQQPLRRFQNPSSVARYTSPGMTLSVSPVHPFVMAGTNSGECVVTNPLRRIFEYKCQIWDQTWFAHEWRPTENKPSDSTTSGKQRQGIVRITEGFKPEAIKLSGWEERGNGEDQSMPFSTIYEAESAVTQVAWNPNIHVGGWVAAGMASGLLRIEDVAIDN